MLGLTRISPPSSSCPEAPRAFPALLVRPSGLGAFGIPDDPSRCRTTTPARRARARARARANTRLLLRRARKDALSRGVISRRALCEGPSGRGRRTRAAVARARALLGRTLEDADGGLEGGGWGDDARDGARPRGCRHELGHRCLLVSTYTCREREFQRAGEGKKKDDGARTRCPIFSGCLPHPRKVRRPSRRGWRLKVQHLCDVWRLHFPRPVSRVSVRVTFSSLLTRSGRSHGSVSVECVFDMEV